MRLADQILTALPSGGAYTSVGTYSVLEAVAIVESIGKQNGQPVPALLKEFGKYLFSGLASKHPTFLTSVTGPLNLLLQIEHHIHVEVKKLYPDAELPHFTYEDCGPNELVMIYRSSRGLADLCEGLILGCYEHFGKPVTLERQPLPGEETAVRFHIREG